MSVLGKIERLQEDSNEGINEKSKLLFSDFTEIVDEKILNEMVLSLTPDNEIYATWQSDRKHCFRFNSDGTIKYFVMQKK